MAIPVIIWAGTALASTAALAYDWVKSATSEPVVKIENATVSEQKSDTEKANIVLKYALLAGGAYVVWKKFLK